MKDKITLLLILLFALKITLKGNSITAKNFGYIKKNTEPKELKKSELEYVDSLNIFFETDKYEISIIEKNKIQKFLEKLDTLHLKSITINAFCDDRGSVNYNEELSIKRANNIEHFLREINIKKPLTYNTSGKGKLKLNDLKSKSTLQQRNFNRRAVIYFYYENPKKKIVKENILAFEETKKQIYVQVSKERDEENIHKLENAKVGEKVTLDNILFAAGRKVLLPESFPTLEKLRDFLLRNQEVKIAILGHICCRPKDLEGEDFDTGIFNLSIARAATINLYLVENGINQDRLTYKGMKANFPTGKGDKYDRRVEIKITQR